ncbi:MAG: glycosyltransferase [Massilia sp.]|nr:glycosyltransferase [Massilia sp.]
MRIVIDLQGAQSSGSRHRGIGRYTLSLARAIARNRGGHEVLIALNGLFADTIAPIRQAFAGLLPQENLRIWEAPGPVSSSHAGNQWRRKTAELLREAFLASLRPDMVLVSSLFEGLGDDAVSSIGLLTRTVPTAVILYDLIPLIRRQPYLDNPEVEHWYESKLDHLRRADLLLAISESSRQEGIRHLGFSPEACVSISTAADPHFRQTDVGAAREREVRARYGLNRDFLMYTGGIDHRKNIEGLIRAYACLPKALRAGHQLAIICSIQPHNRLALEQLALAHKLGSDELVLTGFVSDEDLVSLYNLCKAFVFPSWHEGFGLPALEAMCCGRAVVAANTSSLPEVVGLEEAMFDPHDESDIAAKLAQVLGDDAFRTRLERHGSAQATLFSWDASARRAIAAAERWHGAKIASTLETIMPVRRPKLAYVAPLRPARSGIADYSAELLPELSRHYDIDVIAPQHELSDPWIKANCTLRSVEWLCAHAGRYDRVLYHFGNSHFHQHMFGLLDQVPGVVMLHDFFLSGVASHMDATGYQPGFWAQSLYRSHGYAALRQRFHASDPAEVMWRYPCNLDVLRGALGLLVHSANSIRLLRAWYGDVEALAPVVIPHLRVPETGPGKFRARSQLGFAPDEFVVCSFGLLGPPKLNHRLLDAWLASSLAADPRCMLVFVGENEHGEYGAALSAAIRRAGLGKRIRITGWTDLDTFRAYLAAADAAVQLRSISRGETSGAVIDCMNHGLPAIVNANGSMADLDEDSVIMLADDFSDEQLATALERLARDDALRARLGARARAIIATRHAPRACADLYAHAIEASYQAAPMLARAMARVEPARADKGEWAELAQALAKSIAPPLACRQYLVDVSNYGAGAAIALGAHGSLLELLLHPPAGARIEPVCLDAQGVYRYARRFTLQMLDCPEQWLEDEPAEFRAGDVLLAPKQAAGEAHLAPQRDAGVLVEFCVSQPSGVGLVEAVGT